MSTSARYPGMGVYPGVALTETEQQMVSRLFADPEHFPLEFGQWIKSYLETSDIQLPRTAIIGGVPGGTELQQLALVSTDSGAAISAGSSTTLLSAAVTITDQPELLIRCGIPTLEFTDTAGGDASMRVTVGGTTYTIARLTSDRAFSWPATATIKVAVSPGDDTIGFSVRANTNPCTVHAGSGYGQITMRILG